LPVEEPDRQLVLESQRREFARQPVPQQEALASLLYYRDVMGGKVTSIAHAKSPPPN
jgi:hypothetical protein